jgi:heme/copper-type cytochrome/quinol oxidase subunit 2
MHAILADAAKKYFWLPEQASTVAGDSDRLYNAIIWLSVFFFVLITVLLVAFVIKYRHKPGEKRDVSATHSMALEITWTVIPSIIVVFLYYYGFKQYMNLTVEPPNAYTVNVTGRTWQWSFTYPTGYSDGELHVPVNVPVRCVLESNDVIHSLSIPAFRVKKDVVPGRYNRLWFQAIDADGWVYLTKLKSGSRVNEVAVDGNGKELSPSTGLTPNQMVHPLGKLPKPVQDALIAQAGAAKPSDGTVVRIYTLLNGISLNAMDVGEGDSQKEVIVDQDGNAPEKDVVQFGSLPRQVQDGIKSLNSGADVPASQSVLAFKDARAFEIFCTAYCGTNHSTMHSRAIVHRSQADFDRWLKTAQKPDPDPRVRGRKLYTKLGCAQCHSVDGTKITGPSWKDLYGSKQSFSDGSTAVVNEVFLHGFIPAPTVRVPVGYPPIMPPFPIANNQIDDIAAYMKTISKFAPAPSMGGGAGVGTTRPASQPTSAPAAAK